MKNLLSIRKLSPRRIVKSIKKETKLPIRIISDLIQIIYIILKYVFIKLLSITKKEICQETVVEVKNDKVVDFKEYKLKKAE